MIRDHYRLTVRLLHSMPNQVIGIDMLWTRDDLSRIAIHANAASSKQ